MMSRIVTATIAAALTLGASTGDAGAQSFPNRPVQLMVAFPAGGGTDIAGRIVAAIAEKSLGQPIVVVNKGGAGGQVGWTELVRQKPDGYYIGFINLPATNTVILDPDRKAIFTEKDFTPIINQVLDPGIIWVRADSPFKTLQDLLDGAKKSPSTIRAATTGILSDDHLAILMTEEAAPGAVFRIVHLDGGATQLKEIMGGNVDVAFDNVGGVVRRVQTGEVRALAVMDNVRSKFLPDVATTKELGYPTIVSSSTRGIAGPKGMPEPVLGKLREVLKKAMDDPEHVEKLEAQGLGIKIMVGEEYAKYFADTHAHGQEIHRVGEEPPAPVTLIKKDRLADGGRLILPLTAGRALPPAGQVARHGAVFRIERRGDDYLAQWISAVGVYPCEGGRDAASEAALDRALRAGGWEKVTRLLRTGDLPDEQCWLRAPGWALTYY